MRRFRRMTSRKGSAAIEFAMVLPVLMIILLGIWEVSRLIEVQQILTNAVREGGRQATAGLPDNEVDNVVRRYLESHGLPLTNVAIRLEKKVVTLKGDTAVQTIVSIPVQDVSWIYVNRISTDSQPVSLSAATVWVRDETRSGGQP